MQSWWNQFAELVRQGALVPAKDGSTKFVPDDKE